MRRRHALEHRGALDDVRHVGHVQRCRGVPAQRLPPRATRRHRCRVQASFDLVGRSPLIDTTPAQGAGLHEVLDTERSRADHVEVRLLHSHPHPGRARPSRRRRGRTSHRHRDITGREEAQEVGLTFHRVPVPNAAPRVRPGPASGGRTRGLTQTRVAIACLGARLQVAAIEAPVGVDLTARGSSAP